MREARFRAWDKQTRKWRVVVSLSWYRPDISKSGICGVIILTDEGFDHFMPIEELELVEYTGLKDKNGKEIYESNLIHWRGARFWATRNPDIGKVERLEGGGWVAFDDYDGQPYSYEVFTKGEVIGNIYEHSYLIAEGK